MDKSDHDFGIRTLILIAIAFLIYFAYSDSEKIYILITAAVLGVLLCYYFNMDRTEIEGFNKFLDREPTGRLKWLNANRGKLGQFCVECGDCGRKKIIQERVKNQFNPCETRSCNTRYQTVNPSCITCGKYNRGNCQCDKCNQSIRHNKHKKCNRCNTSESNTSYCVNGCEDDIGRDTVPLLNDEYIDTSKIFCYNCAKDLKSIVLENARNYRELPAINGPAGYSVYRDNSYKAYDYYL
jgi:hypothetical protein